MSLQRKFAVLIGLLSLTAAVSLGGAIWSVGLLQQEVSTPFLATTQLTRDARAAIEQTEKLQRLLSDPGASAALDESSFDDLVRGFRASALELGDLDYGAVRLGSRTAELLKQTTGLALQSVQRWFESPTEDARERAIVHMTEHASLLKRIESQAVESAELALSHVANVRQGILFVQVIAVVTALLAGVLAFILHRRWIVEPVGRLRVGAERLATGDLDYRVPESGTDELALLGHEVNVMAATVKRMQAEAVERERFAAVGQVVRRIAHNIRNPLAGIRGLAETALDDLQADSEMRDSQSRIITTVDRFDSWLNDFLNATSPNDVSPGEHACADWLESCLAALRPMAEARGVKLRLDSTDAPDSAFFDPAQLEQAVVAVVTNAVEISPPGGTVAVSVNRQGQAWEISVLDEGPGIDPRAIERIFDADYTTKPGGHGIGLTAARWIVRQHGGMMQAQNAPEGSEPTGAVFTIRLPIGCHAVHDDGEVDRAKHSDN